MFNKLTGIISYLVNIDYEQLANDYGQPALIIFASFLLARYVYNLLQKTFCNTLVHAQTFLNSEDLSKISAIFTLLVPVTAIDYAVRSLLFPENDNIWLYTSFLVIYQIILSLLLVYTIEPLLKSWVHHYIKLYKKIDYIYAEKLGKILERRRMITCNSLKILLLFIPAMTIFTVFIGLNNIIWLVPTLILLSAMLAYFRLESTAKKQLKRIEAENRKQKEIFNPPEHRPMPNDPDFVERIGVTNLFLEIFKKQIGVSESTPAYFEQVEYNAFRKHFTYELRVKVKNNWEFRRMSIGRLGDSNTSRCKCFYVIYGEYIVVKIPAKKIKNLKEYIYTIKREQNIAEKTKIQECITPHVSIILKHITESEKGRPHQVQYSEDFYLRLLFNSSSMHKYLKVNDQYVFFMDLSQYYFVEHAMKSIHSIDDKVTKDIFRQSELAWDLLEYEYRYGSNIVRIISLLRKIYNSIETEYRNSLNSDPKTYPVLQSFQLRQWFFGQIAGYHTEIHKEMDPELVEDLSLMLKNSLQENITFIDVYRQIVRDSVYKSEFYKNKTAMESLTVNLLRFLDHLRDRKVAMRDIKPDNLLLAGDKKQYPGFMAHPDTFRIGLIDVETAAYANNNTIKQPLLGGTPHYATPSHFFSNDVLEFVFHDLQTTLHMQDWNAVMVIIYKLITGDFLFEKTSQKISYVIQAITRSQKNGMDIHEVLKQVSKKYWNSALVEFDQKMIMKEQLLKEAKITIPKESIDFFSKQLSRGKMSYRLSYSQQEQILKLLRYPEPGITIYHLLEIIFSIILQHMYKPEWNQ
jgi:serine/threonine protein kinase